MNLINVNVSAVVAIIIGAIILIALLTNHCGTTKAEKMTARIVGWFAVIIGVLELIF